MHRLILTRTWTVSDEWAIRFAAYRCGIEFGDFNPAEHKVGFFVKTLPAMVPADIIAGMKQKDLEQKILDEWAELTRQKLTSPHQTAVKNYLIQCQAQIKQYGCATFVGRLTEEDDEPVDTYVYFGLRAAGYLMLDPDGNIMSEFGYDQAEFEWPEDQGTDLTIKANGKKFVMEMNGIAAMRDVAQFLQNAKCPGDELLNSQPAPEQKVE